MSYIQLSNFRFGLDTRKSELTSVAGTLEQATDVAVNQGGELEVRKAFVPILELVDTNPSTHAGNCFFGLQETSTGINTYFSIPGVTLGASSPNINPIFVHHPATLVGLSTIEPITAVLYSTCFNGRDWVVVQFSDGSVFPYYNSSGGGILVVPEFVNGLFLAGTATQHPANRFNITYLQGLIAALQGFHTSAVTNPSGNQFTFQMWSDPGLAYSVTDSVTSAAGTLVASLIYSSVPGVAPVAAQASFQVTGGSFTGGAQITSIKINGVEVLNTTGSNPFIFPVTTGNLTNDNQIAAANLANLISLAISNPDYTAAANGNLVSIIDNSSQGAADNGFVLQITSAGNMMVDNASFAITGTGSTTSIIAGGITVGATSIINSTVTEGGGGTDVTYAAQLVAAIQAFSGTSGYTAFAVGGTDPTVCISKLVRNSNDPVLALTVVINAGPGTIGAGTGGGTVVTGALNVTPQSSAVTTGPTGGTSPVVSLTVSGGTAPYTYAWSGPPAFTINSPNASATSFSRPLGGAFSQGQYQCVITDSTTPKQQVFAYCTVSTN
jgi:hypothetical protein